MKQNVINKISLTVIYFFYKLIFLFLVRGKRDNFEDEISTLNEYINNLKKETKFQLAEIKLLDNQNKILIKENVS